MDDLLTPKELAGKIKVSEQTLANWRATRKGPAFIKMGGKVVYSTGDIERFLEKGKYDPEWEQPRKSA